MASGFPPSSPGVATADYVSTRHQYLCKTPPIKSFTRSVVGASGHPLCDMILMDNSHAVLHAVFRTKKEIFEYTKPLGGRVVILEFLEIVYPSPTCAVCSHG